MHKKITLLFFTIFIASLQFSEISLAGNHTLTRLKYQNPNLVVDLGVGLWAQPLPMDYDNDGDYDLLISTTDRSYNGLYFFENKEGNKKHPVFQPGIRISAGLDDVTISYDGKNPIVTTPGKVFPDVKKTGLTKGKKIPFSGKIHNPEGSIQAEEWSYVDFNGNGVLDLVVGIGDYREDVSNKLGYVYYIENKGTNSNPNYQSPVKVQAGGKPINVYGNPSPVVADFNGDGKLDIITGEFLDKFTYFENTGSWKSPQYASGRYLKDKENQLVKMDLQMLKVTAIDWTKDGHMDLVVGQEDGRVALLENTGEVNNGMPIFKRPYFFEQKANEVKVGVLATPVSFDWNGDGKDDLLVGDSSGRISYIENLNGGNPPKWGASVYLKAAGSEIRIQPGDNGQPEEEKWGYTSLSVADWNHDTLPDILLNSVTGEVIWYQNIGTRKNPNLAAAQPIEVEWVGQPPKPKWNTWVPEGNGLVTQWRTNPFVIDLNEDGLNDLVMLDYEGYLSFYERKSVNGSLTLLPGKRIFIGEKGSSKFNRHGEAISAQKGPIQMNTETKGGSGRRKFTMTDWNGDGKIDLIVNGKPNIKLLLNVGTEKEPFLFRDTGDLAVGLLAGHSTAPTVVDWDKNGIPDLLTGAEDGHFYYLENFVQPFTDVINYKSEITFLKDRGILTGYSDGSFRPKQKITRAEAVTMLLRAQNINLKDYIPPKLPFTDISKGDRWYKEIAKAYELGYIDGKVNSKTKEFYFEPSAVLTRGQMAKIMTNAFHFEQGKGETFTDVLPGDWDYQYIQALSAKGVTRGYDDHTFKPNLSLTREHFSLFIARTLNEKF